MTTYVVLQPVLIIIIMYLNCRYKCIIVHYKVFMMRPKNVSAECSILLLCNVCRYVKYEVM